jgi:transposase
MLTVDDYGRIRRAHRDGTSVRAIARTLGHSRRKIRQVLAEPEPQPYTLTQARAAPKLDPVKAIIDEILADDEQAPRKQRHTAMQLYRRLCAEHGYLGGYDQIRRYVQRRRRSRRETFIPLSHDPGQRAEADFGHIYADFPEGRRQVPVLVVTWAYSNRPFAKAFPTERIEAILDGLVEAWAFFGGVPREVWWDNPRTVVTTLLTGRQRRVHERYAALASHYAFEPLFCLPGRGNEKPRVENKVYDLERRWATPVPRVKGFDDLNAHLLEQCLAECRRTTQGQSETIGERFKADQAAAMPLPPHPFDPCVWTPRKVDKYQTVRCDGNRYSAPRRWAFQTVTVKAYPFRVEVVADGQVIARHDRLYGRHEQSLDPLHYLVTLGRRPAALDHSDLYRHWRLPASFAELRAALHGRHGRPTGDRQYVRVLQLLAEHPLSRVRQALERCLQKGWLDAQMVAQTAQRLAVRRPVVEPDPLNLPRPELAVDVPRPDLKRFDQLLPKGESPPCLTAPSCY